MEERHRACRRLSNGDRLSIIQRLRLGERCVCDLTDALDATQSRLSLHLKVLKDAELVSDRKDWRWVYYTLTTDTLAEGASWWMRWRPLRRQRTA